MQLFNNDAELADLILKYRSEAFIQGKIEEFIQSKLGKGSVDSKGMSENWLVLGNLQEFAIDKSNS